MNKLAWAALALSLAACSQPAADNASQAKAPPAAPTAEVKSTATACVYDLDKTHASVTFRVDHLGMSRYTARFTGIDGRLNQPGTKQDQQYPACRDPAQLGEARELDGGQRTEYQQRSAARPPDGGEGPEELPAPGSNLSQDISIITNIDKLLKRSLEKGAEIVGAATSCLFMIDEAGRLDRAADLGEEPGQPWIAGAAERVLWENQPLIMNRHDAEGNPAGPGAAGGRHSLLVPVNLRGKAIGVCCMQRPVALDTFTERDIRIAGLYVSQAASAIENAYLYQRMIDRNVAVRQQSVTPAIEEKMKKAIAYIRENYRSDISREGLAASLNMHPDSFGRFFKVYTNKKISEFINELRVMEAARKLRETNANIIDIAFSVGFESLPTFNRAFLKIMNVTPTKYRGEKE